jgi:acyl carrier protein
MPPESAVATQIRTALAQHLKREVSQIHPQDNLREDLGVDSLTMIELLFKIEEAFDLEIPDEDLSKFATVGDVIAYVEGRLDPAAPARAAAAAPAATAPAARVAKDPAHKKKGSRRA